MLYEVINPSDKTVCEAEKESIACFCIWTLSSQFWIENEEWKSFGIPAFHWWEELYKKYISHNIEDFVKENKEGINECFKSFMYWDFDSFKERKKVLEMITEKEKKEEYLSWHENESRTSMNEIVKRAWNMTV